MIKVDLASIEVLEYRLRCEDAHVSARMPCVGFPLIPYPRSRGGYDYSIELATEHRIRVEGWKLGAVKVELERSAPGPLELLALGGRKGTVALIFYKPRCSITPHSMMVKEATVRVWPSLLPVVQRAVDNFAKTELDRLEKMLDKKADTCVERWVFGRSTATLQRVRESEPYATRIRELQAEMEAVGSQMLAAEVASGSSIEAEAARLTLEKIRESMRSEPWFSSLSEAELTSLTLEKLRARVLTGLLLSLSPEGRFH